MKAKSILFTFSLLSLTFTYGYDLHIKTLTPIKEQAKPAGGDMVFVKDGKLNFAVVIDAQAETRVKSHSGKSIASALVHLTNAIFRTTGRLPAVVDENDAATLAEYEYRLALGDSKTARAAGFDMQKLEKDGFMVKTWPKGIVVAGWDSSLVEGWDMGVTPTYGTAAGTKFGVMDFCERFLGCRWYYPGEYGSIYPKVTDLVISPVHYEEAPYFLVRGGYWFCISTFLGKDKVAYWKKYLGEGIKENDYSFIDYWRSGWWYPSGGWHCPDPLKYAKAHPDKLKTIFYTDPFGHFWYSPNQMVGNYFDVVNLKFADLLIEDVKDFYASKGRKNQYGFEHYVNDMYVSFGAPDTYMPVQTMLGDPTVKKLGLISEADLRREPDAVMANVYGRFIQYFANRVNEEFPGKKVGLLAYYNTKCAPTDPRWKVPDNVDIFLCDGRLPRKVRSKKFMAKSRQLFKEWYDARGGKPAERTWMYTSPDNPFQRAMIPEFSGEVSKALAPYQGRVAQFFDFGGPFKELWHYWYAAYVQYHSEWNPDFPVDAAIDEAFDLMFGEKAGAHMKAFHRIQKDTYLKYALETDDLAPVYPPETVNAMERELKAAGEAVKGDAVREKRWKLVSDFWWSAFELQRKQAVYEPPVYSAPTLLPGETIVLDGKGDETAWNRAAAMPLINPRGTDPVTSRHDVRLLWDEKGVYGKIVGFAPALKDKGDIYQNDSIELYFSPGLKKTEYYQLFFDFEDHLWRCYKKEAPIPQPGDLNWKAEGFRHVEQFAADDWTCEFFVPFSVFRTVAAPKAYDDWNLNLVINKKSEPKDYVGSSLTMRLNSNLAMFGILRFDGRTK